MTSLFLRIMPISCLQGALMTQKILIIQILGKNGWNSVTIHETYRSLYNGTNLAASFLSHQEISSSSVATTGKLEYDPMMGSVFKELSESCNQANENWDEPASEEVTKVVSFAFKGTLSETAFKNLLTEVTLPENCKFVQAKLVYPAVLASASPAIRSTDIKQQEVQLYKIIFSAS